MLGAQTQKPVLETGFFMGLQRGCGLFFQFTQPIGSDGIG